MFKLIKNEKAVSQVLSYILSLGITAAVITAAGFLTTYYADENTKSAAQAEAENIANRVINLLVNAYIIKHQYPNANYSTSINIPLKLVNHYDYIINVNDTGVYVNSNDNRINIKKTYFTKLFCDYIRQGTVQGAEGKLTININELGEIIVQGGG